MLICAEGCFVIPRRVGAVAGPVPGSGVGGPGGGDRRTGPRDRGGGARGVRRAGLWGRRGWLGDTLVGCQATRGGSQSSCRCSGALWAAPSFKIAGFITVNNRFLKNSKSHPELHQASPKGSQEFQRIPQVASTAPPRVPQGTPKSPWGVGRASRASLGGHGGRDPWGPWGSLGVIGVPWVPWGVSGVFGGAPGALLRSAFFEHLKLARRAPRSPP